MTSFLPSSRCVRVLPLLFTWFTLTSAFATEIKVSFDAPSGNPVPLRLNQASNGWTHPDWSQYFNDIGVEYRRMDHWNDGYNPVRRRTDGSLWFDSAFLDATIYDATGGYSFKAYPTVDLCPICLDTDFLQGPLQFARGSITGWMTPVGTLVISGQARGVGSWSTSNEAGLYEVDRKGQVLWQKPYQQLELVTPSNRIIVKTDTGYAILGPDRRELFRGPGIVLQELDGTSFLVASGSPDNSRKLSQVDLKGTVMQTFPGTFPGNVLLTKNGLFSYEGAELFLYDKTGKHSLQKFDGITNPRTAFALNPRDPEGRVYCAIVTMPAPGTQYNQAIVYAFSPAGQLLWKSVPVPLDDLRGLIATRDGTAVVGVAGALYGVRQTGIIWRTGVRGCLDMQLLSTPGMETAIMRTYEDEIEECDLRTGDLLWRYGENSDQSYWACVPPKDLDGWQATIAYFLKHYNKDLGLGWDRWECWNEPSEQGYFWHGTWLDYAHTIESTMKAVQQVDPSIVMDAFDGTWYPALIKYCNDKKVRLDAISWHGYLAVDGDFEGQEQKALSNHLSAFPGYTLGKLQLSNSEWNLHPGNGQDLSGIYTAGYYRAPFQSEMVYLMGNAGVKFSSEFCTVTDMTWPAGWVYNYAKPVGGKTPPAGAELTFVTPAYNAARLWAMLPQQAVPVTNDFVPQMVGGSASRVNAIAACDPKKGEYGLLVWNYSNNSPGAKDETVNLTFNFKNETLLHLRHFIIDADHSFYGKDWNHQWLEAAETADKSANDFSSLTVTLKKDSLHAFFFTRQPLKANAGPSLTVEAHHPVQFDASASTGLPAFYRWDTDASDGVDFPEPDSGPPSKSHLFGMKPILAHGYDKPGTYTVTLRVSEDGYPKVTDTATITVTVVPEKTAPEPPRNLITYSTKTDHQIYLQWDALNFARNPDIKGFNIYRQDGGAGDWRKLASGTPATSYVDSGVAEGTPYRYRVTAFDSSGNEGLPSNEAAATFQPNHQAPKMPVNLKGLILNGTDIVKLDWDNWDNDNLVDAACVTGYNIYRRTIGVGDWQKLTDSPIFYKRYYDEVSNVGMAGHYQYCVTAVDFAKNESLQTDPVTPSAK